ncbi:MAG TPA: PEP-CTERM sorting domain-containing protein [Tepidisphaeraceae bacterium]|jgi:hypothetical protein
MKYRHILSLVVAAAFLMVSRVSTQAAVVLSPGPGSDTYTYDAYGQTTLDSNGDFVNIKVGGYQTYGDNLPLVGTPVSGTVSYTFNAVGTFDSLNLVYESGWFAIAAAGADTITGTYTIGANPAVQFMSESSTNANTLVPENQTISAINASSITITWTLYANGGGDSAARIMLLPAGGPYAPFSTATSALFTATATFVPEPGTLSLIGMLGLALCRRRRV